MAFGGLYVSSSATTTLGAATPAKAAGTTASTGANQFTVSTSNRLTYTGTATRTFLVNSACSISTVSGAETVFIYIYKNGSAAVNGGTIKREVSNNDVGAVAISTLVSLATNDYLEIWLETTTGDDVVVDYGTLVATVAG